MSLTLKEKQFCKEYVDHGDLMKAYHNSGYSLDGDPIEKCYNILNKKSVQGYLKKLKYDKFSNSFMSLENVLSELSKMASFNFFDLYEKTEKSNKYKLKKEIPVEAQPIVKYISLDNNCYTYDKLETLKTLIKAHEVLINKKSKENDDKFDLKKLGKLLMNVPDIEIKEDDL